jgi:GT2 family glycosyltransferase
MASASFDARGGTAPSVSAVVLAYRDEPWLERCVHALLNSEGVDVEVVLVDNGCTDGAVDRLAPTASPAGATQGPGWRQGISSP